MKFDDIGKNVKLNHISVAFGKKIIPKDTFGVVVGHPYEFEIRWNINGENIYTTIPHEQLSVLENSGIFTVLDDSVAPPGEPLFKRGELVTLGKNQNFLIEKVAKFDVAIGEYEYYIRDLESIFWANSSDDFLMLEHEKSLTKITDFTMTVSLGLDVADYEVTVKHVK